MVVGTTGVPPPNREHDHAHSHNCIHDHLTRASETVVSPQSYAVPLVPTGRHAHGRHLAQSLLTHEYPAEATHGAERRPLRIHVDTSHIDADPGHACFRASDHEHCAVPPYSFVLTWSDVISAEKLSLIHI